MGAGGESGESNQNLRLARGAFEVDAYIEGVERKARGRCVDSLRDCPIDHVVADYLDGIHGP